MSGSLIDDIGYPTTRGYVKKHNVAVKKLFKKLNSKRQRADGKALQNFENRREDNGKNFYLSTRNCTEKEHHNNQRFKDIDRTTINHFLNDQP